MRICVLMGSPRANGNTKNLLEPFIDGLKKQGSEVDYISLYEQNINPCYACRTCQNILDGFGCPQQDDMQDIFDKILASDCFVLATPIYSWYCTPPMKAMLDRLVYGMNKYYGNTKGPCLWEGKKCAILATCGYKVENGADLFEQGMIRFCKHSSLNYLGMLAVRDKGYNITFRTDEKDLQAREFANKIFQEVLCQ